VVAPCPHDGMCPLAAASSKAWCHFGTRFQRPGFMQEAKAPAGHRVNPSDFQDERYSYVVLRWVRAGRCVCVCVCGKGTGARAEDRVAVLYAAPLTHT
jgi:ribosomal protein RSM22 (predicted rRNA methylase)